MTTEQSARKMLPILEYIHRTYLADVKAPGGEGAVKLGELAAELEKLKGKREAIIQYLRSRTPFQRFILDSGKDLNKINRELSDALEKSDANLITQGYFSIASLLISLKLWRGMEFPIEKLERKLDFTPEEIAFLDYMMGMDTPLASPPKTPDPIATLRSANVDKYELWENDKLLNPDYEEPLRTKVREYILEKLFIQRIDNFGGTKKPLPPNQFVKPSRKLEDVPDITYFHCPSQFFQNKFVQLRNSTYKALSIERHESGGYSEKRIQFNLEGDKLVEVQKGLISATAHFLTPHTIWQKMVEDVKLLQQTLTMGAKKIDKDYFFNTFYHIQKPVGLEAQAAAAGQAAKVGRFEPSKETDPFKHRDRLTAETASQLIREVSRLDQYVFGGHLDLDLYLDSIGIRKKPNVLMIEGESLGCYDYINNLIILPTLCPPKITPLVQVVSALADFRYSLWIDTPKDIFEKQGVGFMIIGRRTSATKPLWQIFPTHATTLLKQRAFREHYVRHILSTLSSQGIRNVGGCEIPITNRIADQKLRQFFDAYIPLVQTKVPGAAAPSQPQEEEPQEEPPAEETAEMAPAKTAAPAPPPAPAPAPKPKPIPAPAPPPPLPTTQPAAACPGCGKPVPPGSKFCLECGAAVGAAAKCTACGAELPSGSKFCNGCGAKQ